MPNSDVMLEKVSAYFRLWGEKENFDELRERVDTDIHFRGTNLWILIFAILVASVGMNIDSVPVVIGAMLISPLMGPINGMGYGIATNDLKMFREASSNLGFAIVASIIASTLYFLITPISTVSSQLLSRTNPTVYDGIVAFIGGMAGMLALGSRLKGNVIPGVAIATALLPPLCTVGYGLATWQSFYMFGGMYLFAINVVCMVVAGLLIAQIVKFPIRRDLSDRQKKRINTIITFVVIVTVVPSVFLAYRLLQQEEFRTNAEKFVDQVRFMPNNYLIRSKIDPKKSEIHLIYAGLSLSDREKDSVNVIAKELSLSKARIKIEEGFSFAAFQGADKGMDDAAHIENLNSVIRQAQRQRDSLMNIPRLGQNLLSEITAFYPQIEGCSYSETIHYNLADSLSSPDHIIVMNARERLSGEEERKIRQWVQNRLGKEKVKVYFEQETGGN